MTIIINGIPVVTESSEMSYDDIVQLAGKKGYPTVAYSSLRQGDSTRSGEMHFGGPTVRLEEMMIFNVAHTGNA